MVLDCLRVVVDVFEVVVDGCRWLLRKPIRDNPKILTKSEKMFLKSEKIFQIVMSFGNHR